MPHKITITDKDIGLNDLPLGKVETRLAARIALFDHDSKIAIIYSSKLNYHKMPGGGVEKNEDKVQALIRETKEETGCNIIDYKEIVSIEEMRTHDPVHQISYCFKGLVDGEKGPLDLQGYEETEGFTLKWLPLEEIINILETEYPLQPYHGKFMNLRDRLFLKNIPD